MSEITSVSSSSSIHTKGGTKPQHIDYVAIFVLVAVALGIRLHLYRFHDVISIDGTGYVGAARKLMAGDISGLSFYGLYPVFVWLTGLLVPDMETAAHLVSVIMGSLLAVPLYLLGLKLFSRPTAFAASVVTIVWSSHLFASSNVATQAMYTTLTLTAIYLVWMMFECRSASHGVWAGLIMGLAFLTRPEAFLLFFVMPLAPLCDKRSDKHLLWRPLLAYVTVFTLILCLNLLLVHHFTGAWQLAAKTSSALIDTLSYHLNIPDMNKIPGMQSMGYLEFMRSYPRLLVSNPLKNLSEMFSTIMPAFLWSLALVGFVAGLLQKERFFNQMFLLCSFAPLVVIVVFYYITGGYVEPFLPVVFLWCAEGGCTIERFLSARIGLKRFSAYNPAVMAASLVYAGALLIPQIPEQRDLSTYTWQEDDSRRDQKNIGLMLKRYLPPGKVMTQATRIAYYSEHEMVGIPNTDLQGIEKAATENEARFLVLHGRMFGTRPPLNHLFAPLHSVSNGHYFSFTPTSVNDGPGLHKYLVYSNPNSLGVIVYEIIR